MARSVLRYKEEGFWVPDIYLEILYCEMLDVIADFESNTLIDEIKEELIYGISGFYSGAIDLDLDVYNYEKIQLVLRVLSKVESKLVNNKPIENPNIIRNQIMSVDENYFGGWHDVVNESVLLKLIQYIKLLVKSNLHITPSDDVNYW